MVLNSNENININEKSFSSSSLHTNSNKMIVNNLNDLKNKFNNNSSSSAVPTAPATSNGKSIILRKSIKINYACICLLAFLTGCDFAVIIPTLWDRLSTDYGGDGVFMGAVISAYSMCGVVSGFVMGKLSDDMQNTKAFYLVSGLFAIAGQVLYFFGISKYYILLSRCICGTSLGASTVALAYIARTTNEKTRTSIISIVMASRQIGLMFGPAFNLFLRKLNFKLFDRFQCDRKSSPGLFMSIMWALCLTIFLCLYSNKTVKLKKQHNNEFQLYKPVRQDDDDDEENKEKLLFSNDTTVSSGHTVKAPMLPVGRLDLYKREFLRVEIIVILLVTFFTYFNQTSLETIVIPFTESFFAWNELHNSLLFCIGGTIIIFSYIIVRVISVKFGDKFALLFGITSILIGLSIGCVLLPFGQRLHDNPSFNGTDVYEYQRSATHLFENLTKQQQAENEEILKNNKKLFPAFVLFVFFDVLGLPAIAISSVALFTKMVHYNMQGLGQGIQRGVLGISTICGPLFAGPFIHNPIVLIGFTFAFLFAILILLIFTHTHLKPIEQHHTVHVYTDEE